VTAAAGSVDGGRVEGCAHVVEPDQDGVACVGVAFPVVGRGGDRPAVRTAEGLQVGGSEARPLLDVESGGDGADGAAGLFEPDTVAGADEAEHARSDDGEA